MALYTHNISLSKYNAVPEESTLTLGTHGSANTEALQLTYDSNWTGLSVTATFNNGPLEPITRLVKADGSVVVPWEAMVRATDYDAYIVFRGYSSNLTSGPVLITRNLKYTVASHASTIVPDTEAPTPTLWQEWVAETKNYRDQAYQYKEAANTSAGLASTSAGEAATSASTASTKAGEATTAANTATTKASEASASATTATEKASEASTSAATASTKASEASTAANTATTKAGEAETSASTATTKAGEAATSASNAAESASSASTSASEAQTAAGTANTKASEATTAANTATTKAGEASSSATTATTKAGEAATSASTASTKASEASASASTATTKAGEASESATAAATSASSAATSAASATTTYNKILSYGANAIRDEQTLTADTPEEVYAIPKSKLDVTAYGKTEKSKNIVSRSMETQRKQSNIMAVVSVVSGTTYTFSIGRVMNLAGLYASSTDGSTSYAVKYNAQSLTWTSSITGSVKLNAYDSTSSFTDSDYLTLCEGNEPTHEAHYDGLKAVDSVEIAAEGKNFFGGEMDVYYPVYIPKGTKVGNWCENKVIRSIGSTVQIRFYDENKTLVDCWGFGVAKTSRIVTPSSTKDIYYIGVSSSADIDIFAATGKIMVTKGDTVYTEYYDYAEPSYRTISLESVGTTALQGIGTVHDTYAVSDGKITRYFGVTDLGLLTWTPFQRDNDPFFYCPFSGLPAVKEINPVSFASAYPLTKIEAYRSANMIRCYLASGTDLSAIGTPNGACVYELATPTTETVTAYTINAVDALPTVATMNCDGKVEFNHDTKHYLDNHDYLASTVYGFHINSKESDTSSAVTYLADAVGMTPVHMDYANNVFNWGTWANAFFIPKPCMLRSNGTVDYYLDENDYTKKADGTASDVANENYDGNAMMEWGGNGRKIWLKVIPDRNDNTSASVYIADHKADEHYHAWSFINSEGRMADHFYTPIYNGSDVNGKLRSISGKTVCKNKTAAQEIALARANYDSESPIWNIDSFSDVMLINYLLILMGKSLDSQAVFGVGNMSSGNEETMLQTGSMNTKGLFWGKNASSSSDNSGVKVFGMENWWANQWRRTAGFMMVNGVYKVKLAYGQTDGSTVDDYNTTGEGYIALETAAPGEGWQKAEAFDDKGFSVPSVVGGSASTYYGDYFLKNASDTRFAIRGGFCNGGSYCGTWYWTLHITPSYAGWSIGAAPSCKPLS